MKLTRISAESGSWPWYFACAAWPVEEPSTAPSRMPANKRTRTRLPVCAKRKEKGRRGRRNTAMGNGSVGIPLAEGVKTACKGSELAKFTGNDANGGYYAKRVQTTKA